MQEELFTHCALLYAVSSKPDEILDAEEAAANGDDKGNVHIDLGSF